MTQNRHSRRTSSRCKKCDGPVRNNSIQLCAKCVYRLIGVAKPR